jgi:hypothetical protein
MTRYLSGLEFQNFFQSHIIDGDFLMNSENKILRQFLFYFKQMKSTNIICKLANYTHNFHFNATAMPHEYVVIGKFSIEAFNKLMPCKLFKV